MSLRAKVILIGALLVLALGCAAYTARATVEAFHSFQQQEALARAADVRSIRPWMTIAYISRTYHVPETYLYQSLQITDNHTSHTSLQTLSTNKKRPINDLIHTVQMAILSYRKQHPPHRIPSPRPGKISVQRGGLRY
ncbi:MAG: hypothetical protein JOZ18_11050 [Chloroflexi bacterium]|nr:hypothetical protein [Chloroflexota bacterium]